MFAAASVARKAAAAGQLFRAGVVPAGGVSPSGQTSAFWEHCTEAAELGFHYIEVNNTRLRLAETYADRIAEFQQEMAMRHLTMAGLALFSHASDREAQAELVEEHLVLGRFLQAVGGRYITHMIAPGNVLNNPTSARLTAK
jgi:sugar phosphate isomerase/epimerase